MYFKREMDAFSTAERDFLGGRLSPIIQNVILIVGQLSRSRNRLAEQLMYSDTASQGTTNEFLLEAFDPQRLSFDDFNRSKYLNELLRSLAQKFHIVQIVLRYEDPEDNDRLLVEAVYGLESTEYIEEQTSEVTKSTGIAKHLIDTKKSYYYMKDLQNDEHYLQRDFAKAAGLKSALACSLFRDSIFVGFVIYFKTTLERFTPEDQQFISSAVSETFQKAFATADQLDRARKRYLALMKNYDLALTFLQTDFHDAKGSLDMMLGDLNDLENFARDVDFKDEEREDFREYISFIRERTEKMSEMIGEASRWSHNSGRIEDLLAVIKESVAEVNFTFEDIGVVYENKGANKPISLFGDVKSLRQVFSNLITNAEKAITEKQRTKEHYKGEITITVWEDEKRAYVDVADNGIGMSRAQKDQIFEKGVSYWAHQKGSGFGLSLCHSIIALNYHGSINVDKEVEEGTVMHVFLQKKEQELSR